MSTEPGPGVAPRLRVNDLVVGVARKKSRPLMILKGIDLELRPGEILGVVGESGCGKSTVALSIIGLLPPGVARLGGTVHIDDTELLGTDDDRAFEQVRGKRIGVVFQDSLTSLNPLLSIGTQIAESLMWHEGLSRRDSVERGIELLAEVGIPEPSFRIKQLPHQLSGGLRQRAAIAIALAPNPDILIADEPTTALDVTLQAQVLDLIARQRDSRGMAVLLITHDLGVVASIADRVAVIYGGQIVESGSVDDVLVTPRHPYTCGLLESVPRVDQNANDRFAAIPGTPPSLHEQLDGCLFAPRCRYAEERCDDTLPILENVTSDHRVACIKWQKVSL